MKIVYCTAQIDSPGGLDRVVILKANYLSEMGYDVTIITTAQKSRPNFYNLNPNVHRYNLNINYEDNRERFFILKLVHYFLNKIKHRVRLKKILESIKADVVVSTFGNEMPHILKIKDGSKKILEIHNSWDSIIINRRKGFIKLIDIIQERRIIKRVRLFDKFIVLTKEDQLTWEKLGVENTRVIYNPRTFEYSEPALLDSKQVIAIGRLQKEKGFDQLIRLWEKIHSACPDWKLHIYGDGPLRESLQMMINETAARYTITLKGVVKDIQEVIKDYSLLVMTSIYEGLPMVLLEAQSAGLPILAYSFPCGPKDVVESGVDGYVVLNGDEIVFVNMAELIMNNGDMRKKMGKRAYQNSSRFSVDVIMNQWKELFDSLR